MQFSFYNLFIMDKEFDTDGLILTIAGIVVGGLLIFGVITMIKQAFKPVFKKPAVGSSQMLKKQHQRQQSIQRDQEQMMRDLKQQIRDGQR